MFHCIKWIGNKNRKNQKMYMNAATATRAIFEQGLNKCTFWLNNNNNNNNKNITEIKPKSYLMFATNRKKRRSIQFQRKKRTFQNKKASNKFVVEIICPKKSINHVKIYTMYYNQQTSIILFGFIVTTILNSLLLMLDNQ